MVVQRTGLLACLVFLSMAVGACSQSALHVGAVKDPLSNVVARHNRYVRSDDGLSEETQEKYLQQGNRVRGVVRGLPEDETVEASAFDGLIVKVSKRHDQYVKNDEDINGFERRTYLDTSELLRRVVGEAKN